MDNAQKAIMIGVGLFITIIIIAAVMLITGMGQDMINNSTNQVSNISSSLQAQLTSQYDEATLTGSQVMAAIKANNTTENMVLLVNNGESEADYGTSVVDNGFPFPANPNSAIKIKSITKNTDKVSVGKMIDRNDQDYYIAPTGKYTSHLLKIADTVVGIFFKKK